jgi:NTP pyrophosphatase (non-canonical NTP hydrolase)
MQRVNVTREGLEVAAKKAINLFKLNELTDELIDLLLRKNDEYKDAWQDFGIFTPLIRVREKLIRVESLIDGRPVLIQDKDVYNELRDIAGYCLLAMLWMDNQNGEEFQRIINKLREDVRK